MSHRPYPDRERALRQLDRHYPSTPATPMLECLRPVAEGFDRLRATRVRVQLPALRIAAPPVDDYRLSTRPGVVSGGQ